MTEVKLKLAALLLTATALGGCAVYDAQPQPRPPVHAAITTPVDVSTEAEDRRLMEFLDRAFDQQIALSPQSMTALGIKRDYDKLDQYTEEAARRSLALVEATHAQMKAEFDYDKLGPDAQISYRLAERSAEQARRNWQWRLHGFPISTNSSPAGTLPVFLINQHRVTSVADADAYISRLREVERVMAEIGANVRQRAQMGIVPPKFIFAPVRQDARQVITGAPFTSGPDSTLLADFKKKVEALDAPATEKTRLITEARAALTGPFRRGFDTFFATLDAIEPLATGNRGAWSLPEGEAYYTNQLRNFTTTTDLTADQIHQIGLDEVKKIHGEMAKIMQRVGFSGTLQQFFEHIKTDPQFKYPNTAAGREQYLTDARAYIDQVMAVAPQWFRRLPKAPLEVRAVEEWRQATAPIAFYNSPAPDGSRPGIYYVNLADMTQVLKPQVETISYHEGAPGHHFQIALAQELPEVPKFRRFGGYGAYSEGWGLYSERLGQEMGFFQDPYSELGMLSAQLWRAVRLVTDTGLHSKRWTREQAIQYFQQNSLLTERDIVKEVERYILWPGQATSYMIGQLKIMELRDKARGELGGRFDIRDFHAAILENGALPLDELERQVDAYIASRRG